MVSARLITSPGSSYAQEMIAILEACTQFELITAFASPAGLQMIAPAISSVMSRGGHGTITVAVDRQGFNACSVFEQLLALKEAHGPRLRLGVVLEGAGLLHAKALFTRSTTGDHLIVGSANLTRSALGTNHELGVLLSNASSDVLLAFQRFSQSMAPRSLDLPDAREFLEARGLLAPPHPRGLAPRSPRPDTSPLPDIIARLPPLEPIDCAPEEHVEQWIKQGYLVGRGRNGMQSFVLRLPQELLLKANLIRPEKSKELSIHSHETRKLGYGIGLIPGPERRILRLDSRRTGALLGRLTLNLPCFGLWMPESYWDVFLAARETLQHTHSLPPSRVRELAEHQREDLLAGGLEREIDLILKRLAEHDLIVPGKREATRDLLVPFFGEELALRTPEVLTSCMEWRTARQRWSPYDQTDTPHRQLMVDIVRATFAATFKTGDWPRRINSQVGRQLASAIEERLEPALEPNAQLAMQILALATTWEYPARSMSAVTAEFRSLLGGDVAFPAPELEALTSGVARAPTDQSNAEDDEDDDDVG